MVGRLRFFRVFLFAVLVGLATPGAAGCGRFPQSTLDPAGPVARSQLQLLNLSLWIMVGVFAVVAVALVYVVVRYRERPDDLRPPAPVEGNHRLEVAWTVAPLLVLAVLAVPTVRDTFALAGPPPGGDVLEVRAVGHQWWWEFSYPDLGIVTANELHIPTGRKIRLTLTSQDVIHSFWVPRLAGKTDVIPGRQNTMWLQADAAGTYPGQCAEFCGTSHANMRFLVVAQTPEDFDAWVKRRQSPVTEARGDLARRGEAIFGRTCMACHTVDGTKFQGKAGPNLTGIGSRQTLAAGLLANTDENLARWLEDPPAVKPGSRMPDYNLKKDEIDALVAYLRGLK